MALQLADGILRKMNQGSKLPFQLLQFAIAQQVFVNKDRCKLTFATGPIRQPARCLQR